MLLVVTTTTGESDALAKWQLVQSGDLDDLAIRIENEFKAVERHTALAVIHAARTGALLKAAKIQVEGDRGYGTWGIWCEAKLSFSARSAQSYMQIASAVPALADPDADVEQVLRDSPVARELAGLPLRQAMRKLAEPKPRALPEATTPTTEPPASSEPTLAEDEMNVLDQDARELTGGPKGMNKDQQNQMKSAYARQTLTREKTGYMLGWLDCLRALGLLGTK